MLSYISIVKLGQHLSNGFKSSIVKDVLAALWAHTYAYDLFVICHEISEIIIVQEKFQQLEFYICWSDIPELVIHIMISLIKGCC